MLVKGAPATLPYNSLFSLSNIVRSWYSNQFNSAWAPSFLTFVVYSNLSKKYDVFFSPTIFSILSIRSTRSSFIASELLYLGRTLALYLEKRRSNKAVSALMYPLLKESLGKVILSHATANEWNYIIEAIWAPEYTKIRHMWKHLQLYVYCLIIAKPVLNLGPVLWRLSCLLMDRLII